MDQDVAITSAPTAIDLTSSDDSDYDDACDSNEISDDVISISSSSTGDHEGETDENSMDLTSDEPITVPEEEEETEQPRRRALRKANKPRAPTVHDPGLDVD